jgi:hypothetical protein
MTVSSRVGVNLAASSCVQGWCELLEGEGYHGTHASLGDNERDYRAVRALSGCLCLLWASRHRDDLVARESAAHRKMASQGREYAWRPLFGLALREKQAPILCRDEVHGERHSLQ